MDKERSKIEKDMDEVLKIRYTNIPLMQKLCKSILKTCKQQKDEYGIAFGEYYMSEALYRMGRNSEVVTHVVLGLAYQKKNGYFELEAKSYNLLGIIFTNLGDMQLAVEYYLKSIEIGRKQNIYYIEQMVNNNIGDLYLHSGEYKQALKYFMAGYRKMQKILEMQEKGKKQVDTLIGGFSQSLSVWLINLANVYYHMGKYETALRYIAQVESGQKEIDLIFQPGVKSIYARIYYEMGQFDLGEKHLDQLLEIADIGNNSNEIYNDFIEISPFLIRIHDLVRAKKVIDFVSCLAKKLKIPYLLVSLYELWIEYYKAEGNEAELKNAYEQYYFYSKQKDKLTKLERLKGISNQIELEKAIRKQQKIQEKNEALKLLSERDALTGLPNRYYLNQYCKKEFENAYKNKQNLGIIILDIDYFKQYNDTFGHLEGDSCLRGVGGILKDMANDKFMAARFGGDEFFVVAGGLPDEQIRAFAIQLKQRIVECQLEHCSQNSIPPVTITQGVVNHVPENGQTVLDFIHMADSALYKAKSVGRSSICFYDEDGEQGGNL